jgi:hypothetical protein
MRFCMQAQLELCKAKKEDQTGWYKDRPVGFSGLACRHCGGKAGIGRYFPNSLRTFSQNNYSQIVCTCSQVSFLNFSNLLRRLFSNAAFCIATGNHLNKDCTGCPIGLQSLLLKLLNPDPTARLTMPEYTSIGSVAKGSRRACYDRIWTQIHTDTNSNSIVPRSVAAKTAVATSTSGTSSHFSPRIPKKETPGYKTYYDSSSSVSSGSVLMVATDNSTGRERKRRRTEQLQRFE